MIKIKRGESYPIFFNIKQDGNSLIPDMIQDLEIHIGESFKKTYSGGGMLYSADRGKWYIFPTTAETNALEAGVYNVCTHVTYLKGETYIEEAGKIMVSDCG